MVFRFFSLEIFVLETRLSVTYVAVLGVIANRTAMIIFNKLVQIFDPVFTTSVTYTISGVALGLGVLNGEAFSFWQLFSAVIILAGVFIVNRSKKVFKLRKKTT